MRAPGKPARRQADPRLEDFRWLLEELRVGLFAQELKTPMPVSVKRLTKIWDARPRWRRQQASWIERRRYNDPVFSNDRQV